MLIFFVFSNFSFRDRVETDVGAVYHQLMDTYHSSPSEGDSDNHDYDQPGPSSRRGNVNWKVACERLLKEMCERSDSAPFREPVDVLEHPDYLQVSEDQLLKYSSLSPWKCHDTYS